MKLPSIVIHIEVAPVGEGFVVQHDVHQNDNLAGFIGGTAHAPVGPRSIYFKGRDEIQAWLANLSGVAF